MLSTLLIDRDTRFISTIKEIVEIECPYLQIIGMALSPSAGLEQARVCHPGLILTDINFPEIGAHQLLSQITQLNAEVIVISNDEANLREAIKFSVAGYLVKPVQIDELNTAVFHARSNLLAKEEAQKNKQLVQKMLSQVHYNEPIGIPTMDGFDFFPVDDIIRCEGLQRCTRIVTKTKTNIISSYNLGEFRHLLEPYGFFSPHKSHLINLNYIRHYKKEGVIVMTDGATIPVSRNKKTDFINQVTHL